MSKKARLPQTPRHILIYDEDWEFLETHFGPTGIKPVGISTVIRGLIHKRVIGWREDENAHRNGALKEQADANTPNLDSPPRSPTGLDL